MNLKEEFELINQNSKELLIKVEALMSAKNDFFDDKQLAKNNEVFLELLDRLPEIKFIAQTDKGE